MTTAVGPRAPFTLDEARDVARFLNVTPTRMEDLRAGMDVELEHGKAAGPHNVTDDDPIMTAKIALAHLAERDDYYQRLAEMEDAPYQDPRGDTQSRGDNDSPRESFLGAIAQHWRLIIALVALVIIIVMIARFINDARAPRPKMKMKNIASPCSQTDVATMFS